MKTVGPCAWLLLVICAAASSAHAQERPVRISVNFGMQQAAGSLAVNVPLTSPAGSGAFEIDDRMATSAMVDVNGSVRVWKNLAFGAGFSRISTEKLSHPNSASVPQPVVPAVTTSFTGAAARMVHGERAVYALASWIATISNRFDVVVSGGPMFFDIEQDVPSVTTGAAPTGLQVRSCRAQGSRSPQRVFTQAWASITSSAGAQELECSYDTAVGPSISPTASGR